MSKNICYINYAVLNWCGELSDIVSETSIYRAPLAKSLNAVKIMTVTAAALLKEIDMQLDDILNHMQHVDRVMKRIENDTFYDVFTKKQNEEGDDKSSMSRPP